MTIKYEANENTGLIGEPPPTQPKATLSEPTRLLFYIAVRSHTLAELFGIVHDGESDDIWWFKFLPVARPWLIPHPLRQNELSFVAATFAEKLNRGCSKGQRYMIQFILNVWNPGLAQTHLAWHFDLFAAMNTLDSGNREAICWWLRAQIWP